MFKARMKFEKMGRARYISHLDLMHTMQRAMARCAMPLWFTEGFNQHAYVSVALPLSTGFSGECEFLDFNMTSESVPTDAVERINAVFPEGLRAIEIYPLEDGGHKVGEIAWSHYQIQWHFEDAVPEIFSATVNDFLDRPEIIIQKRSKRAEKTVNMKEWMRDFSIEPVSDPNTVTAVVTTAAGNNNLSPEYLTRAIAQYLPQFSISYATYHRLQVFTENGERFR